LNAIAIAPGSVFSLRCPLQYKPESAKNRLLILRIIGIIVGILIAAIGGVIAYRALFLEPSAAVVITETEVRELPNTARMVGGMAMLALGAIVAFLAARKRKQ
jgi:hypothetical protein